MNITVIILSILVVALCINFVIDKLKRPKVQTLNGFLIFNDKGIIPGKIGDGDIVIGKRTIDNKFIAAQIDGDPEDFKNWSLYLKNAKTNGNEK